MSSRFSNQWLSPNEPAPLTVEECRKLMDWKDLSDAEVEEFLVTLRAYLARFLDEYFREELSIDDII